MKIWQGGIFFVLKSQAW
jgi:hypothetical protein